MTDEDTMDRGLDAYAVGSLGEGLLPKSSGVHSDTGAYPGVNKGAKDSLDELPGRPGIPVPSGAVPQMP